MKGVQLTIATTSSIMEAFGTTAGNVMSSIGTTSLTALQSMSPAMMGATALGVGALGIKGISSTLNTIGNKPRTGTNIANAITPFMNNNQRSSASESSVSMVSQLSEMTNILSNVAEGIQVTNTLLQKLVDFQSGAAQPDYRKIANNNARTAIAYAKSAWGRMAMALEAKITGQINKGIDDDNHIKHALNDGTVTHLELLFERAFGTKGFIAQLFDKTDSLFENIKEKAKGAEKSLNTAEMYHNMLHTIPNRLLAIVHGISGIQDLDDTLRENHNNMMKFMETAEMQFTQFANNTVHYFKTATDFMHRTFDYQKMNIKLMNSLVDVSTQINRKTTRIVTYTNHIDANTKANQNIQYNERDDKVKGTITGKDITKFLSEKNDITSKAFERLSFSVENVGKEAAKLMVDETKAIENGLGLIYNQFDNIKDTLDAELEQQQQQVTMLSIIGDRIQSIPNMLGRFTTSVIKMIMTAGFFGGMFQKVLGGIFNFLGMNLKPGSLLYSIVHEGLFQIIYAAGSAIKEGLSKIFGSETVNATLKKMGEWLKTLGEALWPFIKSTLKYMINRWIKFGLIYLTSKTVINMASNMFLSMFQKGMQKGENIFLENFKKNFAQGQKGFLKFIARMHLMTEKVLKAPFKLFNYIDIKTKDSEKKLSIAYQTTSKIISVTGRELTGSAIATLKAPINALKTAGKTYINTLNKGVRVAIKELYIQQKEAQIKARKDGKSFFGSWITRSTNMIAGIGGTLVGGITNLVGKAAGFLAKAATPVMWITMAWQIIKGLKGFIDSLFTSEENEKMTGTEKIASFLASGLKTISKWSWWIVTTIFNPLNWMKWIIKGVGMLWGLFKLWMADTGTGLLTSLGDFIFDVWKTFCKALKVWDWDWSAIWDWICDAVKGMLGWLLTPWEWFTESADSIAKAQTDLFDRKKEEDNETANAVNEGTEKTVNAIEGGFASMKEKLKNAPEFFKKILDQFKPQNIGHALGRLKGFGNSLVSGLIGMFNPNKQIEFDRLLRERQDNQLDALKTAVKALMDNNSELKKMGESLLDKDGKMIEYFNEDQQKTLAGILNEANDRYKKDPIVQEIQKAFYDQTGQRLNSVVSGIIFGESISQAEKERNEQQRHDDMKGHITNAIENGSTIPIVESISGMKESNDAASLGISRMQKTLIDTVSDAISKTNDKKDTKIMDSYYESYKQDKNMLSAINDYNAGNYKSKIAQFDKSRGMELDSIEARDTLLDGMKRIYMNNRARIKTIYDKIDDNAMKQDFSEDILFLLNTYKNAARYDDSGMFFKNDYSAIAKEKLFDTLFEKTIMRNLTPDLYLEENKDKRKQVVTGLHKFTTNIGNQIFDYFELQKSIIESKTGRVMGTKDFTDLAIPESIFKAMGQYEVGDPVASASTSDNDKQKNNPYAWTQYLPAVAQATGIPESFLAAIIATESSGIADNYPGKPKTPFNENLAYGLMQVKPAAVTDVNKFYGLDLDRKNPIHNLLLGALYYRMLSPQGNYGKAHGMKTFTHMLMAYNGGPTTFENYRKGAFSDIPKDRLKEMRAYPTKIFENYNSNNKFTKVPFDPYIKDPKAVAKIGNINMDLIKKLMAIKEENDKPLDLNGDLPAKEDNIAKTLAKDSEKKNTEIDTSTHAARIKQFLSFQNGRANSRFMALHPVLREQILKAAEEFHAIKKRNPIVTSTARTYAEQKQLWDNRHKNPYTVGNPDNKPSRHQIDDKYGRPINTGGVMAIDFSGNDADEMARLGILSKYGLHRPVRNDRVHIELMPNMLDGNGRASAEMMAIMNQYSGSQNGGAGGGGLFGNGLFSKLGSSGNIIIDIAEAIIGGMSDLLNLGKLFNRSPDTPSTPSTTPNTAQQTVEALTNTSSTGANASTSTASASTSTAGAVASTGNEAGDSLLDTIYNGLSLSDITDTAKRIGSSLYFSPADLKEFLNNPEKRRQVFESLSEKYNNMPSIGSMIVNTFGGNKENKNESLFNIPEILNNIQEILSNINNQITVIFEDSSSLIKNIGEEIGKNISDAVPINYSGSFIGASEEIFENKLAEMNLLASNIATNNKIANESVSHDNSEIKELLSRLVDNDGALLQELIAMRKASMLRDVSVAQVINNSNANYSSTNNIQNGAQQQRHEYNGGMNDSGVNALYI